MHSDAKVPEILAAIAEYELKGPNLAEPLRSDLAACVVTLREELELRKSEPWRS